MYTPGYLNELIPGINVFLQYNFGGSNNSAFENVFSRNRQLLAKLVGCESTAFIKIFRIVIHEPVRCS